MKIWNATIHTMTDAGILEALLYSDVNRFDYRIEDGVARIERSNL